MSLLRHNSKFIDEPEFQSLLVACLESLQRGESINRDALATDFPQYADELARFLDDHRALIEAASSFSDAAGQRSASSAIEATVASGQPHDDFAIGDSIRYIGEYEVLDEIARGGMGVVYKARQQSLKRIVALKMILAGRLADSADVQRFQLEAQAAGRLKHPNIVPVHEIGEFEGHHYFTMDYIDGRSLSDEVRESPLTPKRSAELLRQVALAVHFAHQQGTLHRDLKPANVLLTVDDVPMVTDFGLAKFVDSVDDTRAQLTASGQILGTPSYMSPEQAAGRGTLVGTSSDIYSLGSVLYACLTGRAPFVADSPVETLLQVMHREPVSPRLWASNDANVDDILRMDSNWQDSLQQRLRAQTIQTLIIPGLELIHEIPFGEVYRANIHSANKLRRSVEAVSSIGRVSSCGTW